MFIVTRVWIYLTFNLLLSNLLFAATPPKFKQGELKLLLNTSYFSTTENYNKESGQFTQLGSNHHLQFLHITPKLQYGLSSDWGISSELDIKSGESKSIFGLRNNEEITDLKLSIYYKLIKKKYYLVPQLKLSFPIKTFDETQDQLILNDGAFYSEMGFWLENKWFNHRFYLYLAYRYVSDGRAHTIPFKAGIYNNIKKISYGLGLEGNEIAKNDEFLLTPDKRENRTDQLNAGSKKFYSINSKIINFAAWMGYRATKNLIVSAKVITSLDGSNAAKGNTYSLNFKWRAHQPFLPTNELQEEKFIIDGIKN